jgi:hypothetical protein
MAISNQVSIILNAVYFIEIDENHKSFNKFVFYNLQFCLLFIPFLIWIKIDDDFIFLEAKIKKTFKIKNILKDILVLLKLFQPINWYFNCLLLRKVILGILESRTY